MHASHCAIRNFRWLTRTTDSWFKRSSSTAAASSAQRQLSETPLKPPTPYRRGLSLDIQRIEPPPPFSLLYREHAPEYLKRFLLEDRDLDDECHLETAAEVDECLSRKPLPCTILRETAKLRITKELAVQDSHGAQVFICTVSPRHQGATDSSAATYPSDTPLVAKVYDPLYYPFREHDPPHDTLDILCCAEMDFTDEAAVYAHLNPSLGGSTVPRYYGAWTFTMSLRGLQRRVPMILMEHVAGIPLSELDHKRCTKEERLNVVAKIMEAEVEMLFVGVRNNDLAPRNVIASVGRGGYLGDPNLRVRMIDFGGAVADPLRGSKPKSMIQDKPDSPIRYYDDGCPSGFEEWVWDEYAAEGWVDWVKKRWRGDKRYQPVPEERVV